MILIVDFGSQTCHLISRRIREMGVEAEIVVPGKALAKIKEKKPKGIILSGGPSSVYGKEALLIDKEVFNFNIPVLGICYGLQVMAQMLGGQVSPGKKKEYGPTKLTIAVPGTLFQGLPSVTDVWMSHFDQVTAPPVSSRVIASTPTIKVAAFADEVHHRYGVQFHPEVHHTPEGTKILSRFIFDICQEIPEEAPIKIETLIDDLKITIGEKNAVAALSGGIDSAVAAVLTNKAIGKNLQCLYVDTGMMRLHETEQIRSFFKNNFNLPLKIISAEKEFLTALKGITDPEEKRKVIGETFIRIFEREAVKTGADVLVQGTIYPDVIESKGSLHADKIKTHHNVGGIPSNNKFIIVEPLRKFYKDEVRKIAGELGFPDEIIHRHVFPGPGLAVRVIGEVTKEKLDILRKADAIVVEEIRKAGLYDSVWMAFAVFAGIKTTGVTGDERKYGETIAVRVIESKDTMTADWVRVPYDVLAKISNRIVTEVFEVVRVVYDITTKPPATMEWE